MVSATVLVAAVAAVVWLAVQLVTGGWRRVWVRVRWASLCRSVGVAVRRDRQSSRKIGPGERVSNLAAVEHLPALLGVFGRPIGPLTGRMGATWRLWAANGQTSEELAKMAARFAAATWSQRAIIEVRSPRSARLSLLWRDPFEQARAWHPPAPGRLRPAFDVHGRPVDLPLIDDWGASWLVGAASGSGKSAWLNALVADLVRQPAGTVHLLGIDLKGGVELAPWAPAFARVATNATAADELLSWVRRFIDRRTVALRHAGLRHVPPVPTVEWPFVAVVVDEVAVWLASGTKDDIDRRRALFAEVAALCRAAGVLLVCALQRPTTDAIPAAARDNLPRRALLRCATLNQAEAVLGWRPDQQTIDQLDTPGLALLELPGREPFLARSTYGETDAVTALARQYARKAP